MSDNFSKSITVTRQSSQTQTEVPISSVDYSDYDLPSYYYPSFDFSLFFIIIGVIIFVALLQFLIFLIGACIIIVKKKNTCKCEKCGKTFNVKGGMKPKRCIFCGAELLPPKCH